MIEVASCDIRKVYGLSNLLQAWRQAARGKRATFGSAAFEDGIADRLLQLQDELKSGTYRPGAYTHFTIREPKRRRISAAPFRDRVVQHALCRVIEQVFEARFIADSHPHAFDLFVRNELGCRAYLRYVDDFALFSDSKATLWRWKSAIRDRLAGLRLQFHPGSAQVLPVRCGIPWLGFVIYPTHRRLKGRKFVEASRRLGNRYDEWQK